MKLMFPPEIIEASIESHFSRFSKKSNIIYLIVLLMICGIVVSMFFIHIEITVQSRGILRSSQEPVPIVSPVTVKIRKT